ncbi:hypothetical protein MMC30_006603 [Trapelia coarctata]|nr:hypothetical protein [Trapelia coarctata]
MLDVTESPYKRASDSPSRQLLWELSRLSIQTQQAFQDKLDKDADGREAAHRAALAKAAAEHERIRKGAERERDRIEAQIQRERKEREEEELREIDRLRQENAQLELDKKRREEERAKALEAEEKKAAEQRAAQAQAQAEAAAEEKERAKKAAQEAEAAKKAAAQQELARRAEEDRKAAQEAAEARERGLKTQNTAVLPPPSKAAFVATSGNPIHDAEHRRYLEIHQKLKEFRKYMVEQSKQNAQLKQRMGDFRRTLRKCVGQLTGGQAANAAPVSGIGLSTNTAANRSLQKAEIIKTLQAAIQFPHPQVDVTLFLATPPPPTTDTKGPALLIYLLNIFAKALVSQFVNEAGVSPKSADPVGTIGSLIFATNDFCWNGISLIDILIAKYHVICPVLFGIYGDESTNEGKRRSGWIQDDGAWITEQRHAERMTGLGAGFAAISLRNYSKSKLQNPYPYYNFWTALARVANVPPNQTTATHFTVLKAMIENNEFRILDFFGNAGKMALRRALIELPQQTGMHSVAAKAVAILPDILRKEKKLYL